MQTIDIVLFAAGLFFIIISYVISEKTSGMKEETIEVNNLSEELFRQQTEAMIEKMKAEIEANARESIDAANDQLSKLSNEKIMAVTDYSNQILEKIESNHSEVVFLYDMLNDKEEELKQLMRQPNKLANKSEEVKQEKKSSSQDKELVNKMDGYIVKKKEEVKIKNQLKAAASIKNVKEEQRAVQTEDIVAMYEDGMSVNDISRELHMGQGEVSLIISLSAGGSHE